MLVRLIKDFISVDGDFQIPMGSEVKLQPIITPNADETVCYFAENKGTNKLYRIREEYYEIIENEKV